MEGKIKEVEVVRHTLFDRVHHWVHVSLMLTLGLTGIQIYYGFNLFGGFEIARAIHMLAAILLAIWYLPVQFYYLIATGEIRDFLLSFDDIRFQFYAVGNFMKLFRFYPVYSIYDTMRRQYFRKYNAGQKFLFWLDLVAVLLIGLTGIAMYWPDFFAGFLPLIGWAGGLALIRSIHFFLFWYFIATTAVHVYLGMIPVNWEHFKSIFTGKSREKAKPAITSLRKRR